MPGATVNLANNLLNHLTGKANYSPQEISCGLLRKTSDASSLVNNLSIGSQTINEISGGGYSRQLLSWNSSSSGTIVSTSSLTFTAGGDWGVVDAVGLYDGYGNLCWVKYLATSVNMASGDTLTVGPFTLGLD